MIAKTQIIDQDELYVVGICIRTTNQNGQAQKDIGELWARFMQNELLTKIADKVSDDIYSVYIDYESDYMGPYTTILGCRVNSLTNVADGFTGAAIASGKYMSHTLSGKFPDIIGEAWQGIWQSNINRKYSADFDVYLAGAKNFEDTKVKIYVAVN